MTHDDPGAASATSESFEHSGSVTCPAPAAAVWALWSDIGTWPDWDPSVLAVTLDGPFAGGTTGTMTLAGPLEVPVTLQVVEPGVRYVDELRLGELTIRIDHVVAAREDGCEVTVATTVTGPGADAVGPMVVAEAPQAMARLVALAAAG